MFRSGFATRRVRQFTVQLIDSLAVVVSASIPLWMFFVGNPTGSGSLSVLQNRKIKKVQALPTTVVYHQCPKNRSVENAKKNETRAKTIQFSSESARSKWEKCVLSWVWARSEGKPPIESFNAIEEQLGGCLAFFGGWSRNGWVGYPKKSWIKCENYLFVAKNKVLILSRIKYISRTWKKSTKLQNTYRSRATVCICGKSCQWVVNWKTKEFSRRAVFGVITKTCVRLELRCDWLLQFGLRSHVNRCAKGDQVPNIKVYSHIIWRMLC